MSVRQRKSKFEKECLEIADKESVDLSFFDDPRVNEAFEDDGYLHVVRRGVRACFGIGQDTPSAQANDTIRRILDHLKVPITPRTLFRDDEEDEDNVCPECGRPL